MDIIKRYERPLVRKTEVSLQEGYGKSSQYGNDPYNDGGEHEW